MNFLNFFIYWTFAITSSSARNVFAPKSEGTIDK